MEQRARSELLLNLRRDKFTKLAYRSVLHLILAAAVLLHTFNGFSPWLVASAVGVVNGILFAVTGQRLEPYEAKWHDGLLGVLIYGTMAAGAMWLPPIGEMIAAAVFALLGFTVLSMSLFGLMRIRRMLA